MLRQLVEKIMRQDASQFLDVYVPEGRLDRLTARYLLEPIISWFKGPEQPDVVLKDRVQSIILSVEIPNAGGPTAGRRFTDKDGFRRKACQMSSFVGLQGHPAFIFKAIKRTADTSGRDSAALRHWSQRQGFWGGIWKAILIGRLCWKSGADSLKLYRLKTV